MSTASQLHHNKKKKEDMIFKYTIYNKIPSKKLTRYMFNLDTETITFY